MAAEVEKVAEGKRRKKRSGGGRYTTSRPRGGRPNPCKLFVSNISFFVTEEQVGDVFAEFGPVKSFQILRDRKTRRSKGCGFVVFEDVASVERALSVAEDQLTLDERTMKVERPLSKKELLAAREGVASGDPGEAGDGGEMDEPLMAVPEPLLIPLLPPQHFTGPELNDDVLLLVMQYLSVKDRIRVERVSKRWCSVAKASWQYVRHVSFEGCFHPFQNKKCGGLTDDILHSVLERGGRNISSLDLSCNPKLITDFGISIIGMYCSNLEKLDLSEMYLTQTAMKKLSQKCPELKWLRVCGAHTVGENCLWWGLHNWKKLEFLDISLNVRVNGKCFFMAGDTLLHVHLQHCKKLLDSSLELLAARVPHLETLDISHCPRLTGASLRSISQIRNIPEVKYIEEETMAEGTQTTLPYHLDRVDQRQLPLNGLYNPIGDGEGVDIYVLDTGISYTHREFGNRAKYGGFDPMDEYLRETRLGRDCYGHGTHVASNAAGERYGAAKKATVYSIRVLDCENRGPWSTTLSGLDYVMRTIPARGRPAVVSMSLSGSYTQSVHDAVQALYRSGIPIVVAAGNGAEDACSSSPASSPDVITVAGSANRDGLYFSTNYGPCVDIFAPGDSILGADYLCDDCSQFLSGTSFSAPIVSGAIAILLQRQPRLTPDQIVSRLTSLSISNSLDFRLIPPSFRTSTPNRALFIPGSCGGEFSTGPRSAMVIQSPNYPSNYLENIHCKWIITGPPNTQLRILFTNFSTESTYDTVELCSERFCEPSSRLATLTGQRSNSLYDSSSNVLSVELRTDGSTGRSGFRATVTAIEIQVPPTDTTVATTSSTTTAPVTTTTNPPTTATTIPPPVVTCPTVPPPVPTLNISQLLRETLTQAEILLDEAVGATLQNLLQVTLDEVGVMPTDPPSNTMTASTPATRPTLPPATTTQPPVTTTQPPPTTTTTTMSPNCLGCSETNPAFYCQDILRDDPSAPSGYYWLRGRWSVERVYCDMSNRFINARGWLRVANLDMSDPSQSCPGNLGLVQSPVRTCGRGISAPGCSSVFFNSSGVTYSRICGRVIGYQFSSPNAFYAHQFDPDITIDQYYVDGVSITRGRPREHVWSFAATLDENARDRHICPCTHSSHSLPSTAIPEFVGENYFCDSGTSTFRSGVFHTMDPLWDGEGCSPESTCCQFNRPPWFCRELGQASTDDLELRICGNENTSNEDTPIEIVEFYVQ